VCELFLQAFQASLLTATIVVPLTEAKSCQFSIPVPLAFYTRTNTYYEKLIINIPVIQLHGSAIC
jgi:hypothetical protein